MQVIGFSGVLPSIEHPASKTRQECRCSMGVMSAKDLALSALLEQRIGAEVGEVGEVGEPWVSVDGLTLYSAPSLGKGVGSRLEDSHFHVL